MNICVRVLSVAVAIALAACSDSGSSPRTAAEQIEAARHAELEARAQELAQREAEIAAREEAQRQETLAREQAVAEAAQREREAQAKLAADREATAQRAAAARRAAARTAPPVAETPVAALPQPAPIDVPVGTALTIELGSDLSTKTNRIGDTFEGRLAYDMMIDGRRALPAGSRVIGTVTDSVSGSRAIGAVPQLALRFDRVELVDGRSFPIGGELLQQGQSEKGRDSAKIIGGAAAGAVIGHQVKNNDKGKVIGGILGGAAGALVARNTGTEVQLPAGSTLTIALSKGFTLSPS